MARKLALSDLQFARRLLRAWFLQVSTHAPSTILFVSQQHGKVRIMPKPGTLHDAFLDELRDAYDAERQLIPALTKMAKAASSEELRGAFESHLEETREHVTRLERVFASIGETARGKHCEGIAGIIEEGKGTMEENFEDATMDACLIAGGQRAEHYEMAAYGTLIAWARTMGHSEAVSLLERTLEEEKAADEKLSSLAEGGINDEAASGDSAGTESFDRSDPSDSREFGSRQNSAQSSGSGSRQNASQGSGSRENTSRSSGSGPRPNTSQGSGSRQNTPPGSGSGARGKTQSPRDKNR
jgi:ferritin-like metal-binding protein YciE